MGNITYDPVDPIALAAQTKYFTDLIASIVAAQEATTLYAAMATDIEIVKADVIAKAKKTDTIADKTIALQTKVATIRAADVVALDAKAALNPTIVASLKTMLATSIDNAFDDPPAPTKPIKPIKSTIQSKSIKWKLLP